MPFAKSNRFPFIALCVSREENRPGTCTQIPSVIPNEKSFALKMPFAILFVWSMATRLARSASKPEVTPSSFLMLVMFFPSASVETITSCNRCTSLTAIFVMRFVLHSMIEGSSSAAFWLMR